MINNILGFGMPGGFEWLIILFIGLIVIVMPICLIVLVIKLANKKQQKPTIEVTNTADELDN